MMLKSDADNGQTHHRDHDGGLTENQRHFQYLAEAAFEGVVIHAKGVLITGNQQAFDMFGYTPHEMIGRNALPLVIAEESVELVTEKIRTKDIGPYEAIGVRKDGTKFPIEVRAREIEWEGRKARVAAVMDITERKRTEKALKQANERLERRVAVRTRELVDIVEKLETSEDALRRLSSKILTAQEDERRRIARELHDSIGQTLSAIKLKLKYATNKLKDESIREARNLWGELLPVVQASIEEVRRISERLRPRVLDDLGILATISWFCAELKATYKEIRFEEEHRVREEEVPEALKIVLYRVLQESLRNVVQHSGADCATIALTKNQDALQLKIEDNGRGFDTENITPSVAPRRGLGLGTMRERVVLAGGEFSVTSEPGRGTTVEALWRLP